MLIKHKNVCQVNQQLKTSPNSHIYWKKYFHKNKLSFRIYADFELIIKKKILVSETEQQTFINKNQYVMDILLNQNWIIF